MAICVNRRDLARNNTLAYHLPIGVQTGRHHDVVARISPNEVPGIGGWETRLSGGAACRTGLAFDPALAPFVDLGLIDGGSRESASSVR